MKNAAVSKMFYSIKEVAAVLEENESTLRYWEGEFQDVISPRRNERGVRFYSEKDINDVRLIKYLIRDCGLTFEGARKRLKSNKESAVKQSKVVQYLKHIREELKVLKEALDDVEKKR
ncbi:MAG TPA: transcriptional regulator [Porphyromonadaceae bacterium]|nr:transcriptional regulator [Porphyromonadaceae bacterium]